MTSPRKSRDPKTLRPATQLIHGGSMRSRFDETSEALFLTQGYLYDTMELAEARFKGDDPGFIYSRFANPTVSMFEQRMALLEGAAAARATMWSRSCCRASASPPPLSMGPILTPGGRLCVPTPRRPSSNRRPIRR